MTRLFDIFLAGGFIMFPLLILSLITLAYAMQQVWLWLKLVFQERELVRDVLTVAQYDLERAEEIATGADDLAIGRFLAAPLRLDNPTPENFHLAVETAADKELVNIGGSDKLLESVMVIAPLLGILGTVGVLIHTFITLRNAGGNSTDTSAIADAVFQALISSVTGILIAILAFAFLRLFIGLRVRRVDNFATVGNQLELIYLHFWNQPIEDSKISQ